MIEKSGTRLEEAEVELLVDLLEKMLKYRGQDFCCGGGATSLVSMLYSCLLYLSTCNLCCIFLRPHTWVFSPVLIVLSLYTRLDLRAFDIARVLIYETNLSLCLAIRQWSN